MEKSSSSLDALLYELISINKLYDRPKLLMMRGANNWVLEDMTVDPSDPKTCKVRISILPPIQGLQELATLISTKHCESSRLNDTLQSFARHGSLMTGCQSDEPFVKYLIDLKNGGHKCKTIPLLEQVLYKANADPINICCELIHHGATNWRLVSAKLNNNDVTTVHLKITSPADDTSEKNLGMYLRAECERDRAFWNYLQQQPGFTASSS